MMNLKTKSGDETEGLTNAREGNRTENTTKEHRQQLIQVQQHSQEKMRNTEWSRAD